MSSLFQLTILSYRALNFAIYPVYNFSSFYDLYYWYMQSGNMKRPPIFVRPDLIMKDLKHLTCHKTHKTFLKKSLYVNCMLFLSYFLLTSLKIRRSRFWRENWLICLLYKAPATHTKLNQYSRQPEIKDDFSNKHILFFS